LTLGKEFMQFCYDQVIDKICETLDRVMQRCSQVDLASLSQKYNLDLSTEICSIDYISIVGGLADSNYVYDRIVKKIDELK